MYKSYTLSIFSDLLRQLWPCVTLSFRNLFPHAVAIVFVFEVGIGRNVIYLFVNDCQDRREVGNYPYVLRYGVITFPGE